MKGNLHPVNTIAIRVDEAEGVLYAEPRFAPGSLAEGGLSQQEVLEAALAGRADFYAEHPQSALHTAYIICAMRGTGEELKHKNEESIDLAAAYLGNGVAAADLAGAEALFATENFSSLFAEAQRKDVPFNSRFVRRIGALNMFRSGLWIQFIMAAWMVITNRKTMFSAK